MDAKELELERQTNLEYLDSILASYRSVERKCRVILDIFIVVFVIAIYLLFTNLLGGTWGYILTIVFFGIGVCCINALGISFNKELIPDKKLAYQACVTMEHLIEIKKGTYRQYGVHIICSGPGTHLDLYKRFIQFYPECACKDLKKLAKIRVSDKDIFN